jgi:transposase-like protein
MNIGIANNFMKLTQEDCLKLLEDVIWGKKPQCPYCKSRHHTQLKGELRYRCNSCHTAYSVTVKTIFHDTRLPLNKWFTAIHILLFTDKEITSRNLASILSVNKNTAWFLMKRIENGLLDTNDRQTIFSIMNKLRGQNE